MRLLITGAAGFIGRNALLAVPYSWQVVALYRPGNTDFLDFVEGHQLHHVQPVACDLTDVCHVEQAVDQANRNPYGLAAAVWTRDIKKAHHISRQLRAGTVWINTYGLMDAALPFGGYKQSGFGRELGAHAVEHYTELKSVWLNMG